MKRITYSEILNSSDFINPTLEELNEKGEITDGNKYAEYMYKALELANKTRKFDRVMDYLITFFAELLAIIVIVLEYWNVKVFRTMLTSPFKTFANVRAIISHFKIVIALVPLIAKNYKYLSQNVAEVFGVFIENVLMIYNTVKKRVTGG